jgi:preprotein translocase subunit YajC
VVTTTVTTTVTISVGGGGGSPPPTGGGSALHNSTVIVLENGVRKMKVLDDVKVGDLVLTDRGFLRVVEKREVTVDNLYTLHVEGGYVLRADDAQPILTKNGVKRVGQLAVGDEVYTIGGWRHVESIDVARFDKPIVKVIDLRFERFAFYYVDGILVEDVYLKTSGVILIRCPYDAFIFIGRG